MPTEELYVDSRKMYVRQKTQLENKVNFLSLQLI